AKAVDQNSKQAAYQNSKEAYLVRTLEDQNSKEEDLRKNSRLNPKRNRS
ncbi:hypothetical protein SOVF_166470, partial [Spinacia oleracea]